MNNWFKIQAFKRHINYKKNYSIFQELYAQIPSRFSGSENQLHLTYGEVEFLSFAALLSTLQIGNNDVFYDLGCGAGKACLIAALCFPIIKAIGIEISYQRLQYANLVKTRCQNILNSRLQFIHNDFLAQSIENATIIFIHATAFFNDDWLKIEKFLINSLKPNVKLIICSKSLNKNYFEEIKTGLVHMAYGPCHYTIYQFKGANI